MNEEIWLVVGKEMDGNHVVRYYFISNMGRRQQVLNRSAGHFVNSHNVLNAGTNGSSLVGKGINLNILPRYAKTREYGLIQVDGPSEQEIINYCQPMVDAYFTKVYNEEMKKVGKETEKNVKLKYIIDKLTYIDNILNMSLQMKDLTNELASEGELTRYLKQVDLNNTEYEPLSKSVKTTGVKGLAESLDKRLNALMVRADKFDLKSEKINGVKITDIIKELKKKCEYLKKLHDETKDIIKDNREEQKKQELDEIPVVSDSEDNLIAIDFDSGAYNVNDIDIVSDDEQDLIAID